MLSALRQIEKESSLTGAVRDLIGPTPGTIRAMERRGLVKCGPIYACCDVSLTDAGRAALANSIQTGVPS